MIFLICSEIDMVVGGMFPNVSLLNHFKMSMAYYQDDLTWCIQRSGYFSKLLTFFLIASYECWIMTIFGVGFFCSFVLYILIQFDLEFKDRNRRDFHYMLYMIMMPAIIGMNQRYQPKRFLLKFLYCGIAFVCVPHWSIFFYAMIRFQKVPIHKYQISTIAEIIETDFRLSGSSEVRNMILFDSKVFSS